MRDMNRRILIADDDNNQLRLFRHLLTSDTDSDISHVSDNRKAYDFRMFNDGKPLLDFFRHESDSGRRIPLCILDMRMTEMHGIETAEALRRLDPEVFIIIVTFYEDISPKSLIHILKKDVYFMNKPIRPREFKALISSLLINWNHQQAIKEAEEKVRENEAYLTAIMSAIQTGIIITDTEQFRIVDVNPYTLKMFQCRREEIIGRDLYEFRVDDAPSDPALRVVGNEYTLKTYNNDIIHVRRSLKKTSANKESYLVQSLLDITDIRNFMKKQEISIELAKHLLKMINGYPPSHTDLEEGLSLYFDAIYLPCFKEGGDHYFVHTAEHHGRKKSIISLKDQSGHDVGCILRSIITDLTHHGILNRNPDISLKEILTLLNREISCSGVFKDQDFFTSVDIAIDHQTLDMEYVSAGHPCFFLIRDQKVSGLPEQGREGRNLPIPVMSDMRYSSARCCLNAGDKLILYSDGLTDLPMMKGGDSLSYTILKSLLQELVNQNPSASVSELIRILFNTISRKNEADSNVVSQENLPDDITIIGLEIEDEHRWNKKILKPDSLEDFNRSIFEFYTDVFEELKQRNFDISDMAIRSVLSESLINAWIHGNRKDKNKSITLRWRYGRDFCLAVEDEGQGFDYHRISDPRCEENIAKPSGRGIYIIRRFSDDVRWEKGGRRIIITIKRNRNNDCTIK